MISQRGRTFLRRTWVRQTIAVNPSAASQAPIDEEALMINEGTLDRVVRVALGLAILSLSVAGPRSLYGLIGILPVVTGLAGFCPLYRLVGIRTYPAPAQRAGKLP